MKNTGRYQANSSESEYEAGSNDLVLKNLLGISKLQKMELLETEKLITLTNSIMQDFTQEQIITTTDILSIHENWLSDIYSWAGQYRTVNMSKGGFTFAAAHLIPKLMGDFEKKVLKQYTPCLYKDKDEIANALAEVHVEFVLIHPFREGNGRLARLISTLMAMQAGLDLLDFSSLTDHKQEQYFAAIRSGLDCNYEPMKTIFYGLI